MVFVLFCKASIKPSLFHQKDMSRLLNVLTLLQTMSSLHGIHVAETYRFIFSDCNFTNDYIVYKSTPSMSNCAALCSLTFDRSAFIWRRDGQCGLLTSCPYHCVSLGGEQQQHGKWSLFCQKGRYLVSKF